MFLSNLDTVKVHNSWAARLLLLLFLVVLGHQLVPHVHEEYADVYCSSQDSEATGIWGFLVDFYSACDSGENHLQQFDGEDGPELEGLAISSEHLPPHQPVEKIFNDTFVTQPVNIERVFWHHNRPPPRC